VATGNDSLRIGHDPTVVEKDVDVVLGRQQGADISLQDEVGLNSPLDRLLDFGVDLVDQLANFLTDRLLPHGESIDVIVDSGILGPGQDRTLGHSRSRQLSHLKIQPILDDQLDADHGGVDIDESGVNG
jgi:hypothetical protein